MARFARLLADPEQAARLDRLQATMAVIEGHAEHVMDACAADLGPDLTELRRKLDERRERRGGLGEVLARLLGLEAKLRQYELGKRVLRWRRRAQAGPKLCAWCGALPADLPSLEELEDPVPGYRAYQRALAPAGVTHPKHVVYKHMFGVLATLNILSNKELRKTDSPRS